MGVSFTRIFLFYNNFLCKFWLVISFHRCSKCESKMLYYLCGWAVTLISILPNRSFSCEKDIKYWISSRLTIQAESLTFAEVMILNMGKLRGKIAVDSTEIFTGEILRLFASRKLKVNSLYTSISELSISWKELKPSCIKENFEKKERELTSFAGRIWVREFKSRFLLTSCNFRPRRKIVSSTFEALNPSNS